MFSPFLKTNKKKSKKRREEQPPPNTQDSIYEYTLITKVTLTVNEQRKGENLTHDYCTSLVKQAYMKL